MRSLVPRESADLFCFHSVYALKEPNSKVIIQVRQPTVIFLLLLFPRLSIIVVMFLANEHQLNTPNSAILFAWEIQRLFKHMSGLAGFNS